MPRRTILLLLALLGPLALHAQGAPLRQPLDSGAVVRFTWRGDGREEARLAAPLGPGSDSVRFCHVPAPACGPGSVNPVRARPAADVARVEVPHGSHLLDGVVGGAAVGLLLSVYALALVNDDESHPSAGRKVMAVGFAMGLPTAIGAMIGSGGHGWREAR